jgi:hypothetical protein
MLTMTGILRKIEPVKAYGDKDPFDRLYILTETAVEKVKGPVGIGAQFKGDVGAEVTLQVVAVPYKIENGPACISYRIAE